MSSSAGLTSQPWAVADMLGQRSLLGVGAFLAWMVLFHLLVNVWLLCMFTSFLVVLGTWLGSQVILDSNRVVHLERFVTLEKIASSMESEEQLDREIENTVAKIIRDFVSSWYSTVSPEQEFENEVQRAMISMAMELKLRSKRVDRKALTRRALDLFGCHFQSYMNAKERLDALKEQDGNSVDIVWKLYSDENTPHPALKSSAVEVNYARAIVDLLLHVLVPASHLETRTGRFVVGELITCNVLLPLITKLSDPDWLNMMIVEVFAKSVSPVSKTTRPMDILPAETPPETPTSKREMELPPPPPPPPPPKVLDKPDGTSKVDIINAEMPPADVVDSAESCSHQDNDEDPSRPMIGQSFAAVAVAAAAGNAPAVRRPMDFLRPGKTNPFYHENDSDLDSPLTDLKKSSESLHLISPIYELTDKPKDDAVEVEVAVDGIVDLEDEPPEFSGLTDLSCPKVQVSDEPRTSSSDVGKIEESSSFCTLHELEEDLPTAGKTMLAVDQSQAAGMALSPSELSVAAPLQASSPTAGLMTPGSFTFDPLSSPEGPVIIQNLRITGTITAKEHRGTGSHPYTLYTVKYETTLESDNPCAEQPLAYHTVNRRYSEFLNLQTRLEEKQELRKIIKNVKGPKKIFPDLPFGNMDTDKVEARKSLLENFLKQLCAIPETANSDEMQEFLALNTDARIAFVKKPFIVSRIDKIVMNAIVDTLKTAFPRSEPQSPTEEGEEPDGKLASDKKSKSRLRFSSKTAPALIVTDIIPKVTYCFDEGSAVFSGLTVSGLEAFIKEQESLTCKPCLYELGPRGEGGSLKVKTEGRSPSSVVMETAVADVALDLVCMLMREQWSWLCTENIQRALRLLFGTLIDRWLDVKVSNLTCTQYWVTYLRVLQEAVWPGGRLPLQPRPQRSPREREETRRQSLHCLMKLLPDVVSDLLGSEKYRLSWQTVLDSLQDPHINRHLVYSIWDLLLEFLVPEATNEAFQKTLLHSLSKNADKLLP